MLERDLQSYLYDNPDVLFPNQLISGKRREVFIEGRRIDLLFEVEGTQYIVEIKRDTIRRQDIGQVFEYYGLMRRCLKTSTFRMILVAPSIPDYRRIPLEEFGIRCVEVPHWPGSSTEQGILRDAVVAVRIERERMDPNLSIANIEILQLKFEEMLPPVNARSMRISQMLMQEGLPTIAETFSEFEIRPVKMVKPNQPDLLCTFERNHGGDCEILGAGAWWAYSFGRIETMAKNDVPNISVNALPWGLDFGINAELKSSQTVMRDRVASEPETFDGLIAEHGGLNLQTWLKIEFQPRVYYWILQQQYQPGKWQANDLLNHCSSSELEFPELRKRWLNWIIDQPDRLSSDQMAHMEKSNQKLNLALRLVHTYKRDDGIWTLPFDEQKKHFNAQYRKLKPLISFFM